MKPKKLLAPTVLVVGLVLGGTAGAYAATAGYQSQIDSGGTIKYFENQRTSTQAVKNYLKSGDGGVTQGLYSCSSFSAIPNVGDLSFTAGQTKTYASASANTCFRIKMSRTNPADTNGILPGSGVTDVSGTITY